MFLTGFSNLFCVKFRIGGRRPSNKLVDFFLWARYTVSVMKGWIERILKVSPAFTKAAESRGGASGRAPQGAKYPKSRARKKSSPQHNPKTARLSSAFTAHAVNSAGSFRRLLIRSRNANQDLIAFSRGNKEMKTAVCQRQMCFRPRRAWIISKPLCSASKKFFSRKYFCGAA